MSYQRRLGAVVDASLLPAGSHDRLTEHGRGGITGGLRPEHVPDQPDPHEE
jgi:hypothetical protein